MERTWKKMPRELGRERFVIGRFYTTHVLCVLFDALNDLVCPDV